MRAGSLSRSPDGVQAARLLLADLQGRVDGRHRKITLPIAVRRGDTT